MTIWDVANAEVGKSPIEQLSRLINQHHALMAN